MPIKIFAAPGDHKDDFRHVESQANGWISENHPNILSTQIAVNQLPTKRDTGQFMLTMVVHYEQPGS